MYVCLLKADKIRISGVVYKKTPCAINFAYHHVICEIGKMKEKSRKSF